MVLDPLVFSATLPHAFYTMARLPAGGLSRDQKSPIQGYPQDRFPSTLPLHSRTSTLPSPSGTTPASFHRPSIAGMDETQQQPTQQGLDRQSNRESSLFVYEGSQSTSSPELHLSPRGSSHRSPAGFQNQPVLQRSPSTRSPSQSSITSDRNLDTLHDWQHQGSLFEHQAFTHSVAPESRFPAQRHRAQLFGPQDPAYHPRTPGSLALGPVAYRTIVTSTLVQPEAAAGRPSGGAMSIRNLLTEETPAASGPAPTPAIARQTFARAEPQDVTSSSATYKLTVRQQPVAARCCGFGDRDRRVVDPPPIVQLTIEDPNASAEELERRLKWPALVTQCAIYDESGTEDLTKMVEDVRAQRRLMGTTVSSSLIAEDENGEEGCFFPFADLSVRTVGVYRLKFLIVVINPQYRGNQNIPVVAQVMSEPFTVYNAKEFPGMTKSSILTRRLKEQGCLISLKKGNDGPRGGRRRTDSPDEDEDDTSSHGRGTPGNGRKKARSG